MAKAASKPLTKSEIANHMVDKVEGLTRKQALQFFEEFAKLAYKQAKNSFVIPGIGKLVLRETPARKMTMRFGPNAGKEIMTKKKKKIAFRPVKAAKDGILGPAKK